MLWNIPPTRYPAPVPYGPLQSELYLPLARAGPGRNAH